METIITRGAEADIILKEWNGRKVIVKRRKPKKFRHTVLDSQLIRNRTRSEADIIHKAKQCGVTTPLLLQVNAKTGEIIMEYINGVKVRDLLKNLPKNERNRLLIDIGRYSGMLHKEGIIHGDLTTSNIIKSGEKIVFIDFGLAEISYEIEKIGVDLNLMNRMLASTHFKYKDQLLEAFQTGYRETMGKKALEALERMGEVAKRGRYIEKN